MSTDQNNLKETKNLKTIGIKEGIVVSDKMKDTIVVEVSELKTHPKYLKKYVFTTKYSAHDPQGKFKIGDKVTIIPCKPISKTKRYKVLY